MPGDFFRRRRLGWGRRGKEHLDNCDVLGGGRDAPTAICFRYLDEMGRGWLVSVFAMARKARRAQSCRKGLGRHTLFEVLKAQTVSECTLGVLRAPANSKVMAL